MKKGRQGGREGERERPRVCETPRRKRKFIEERYDAALKGPEIINERMSATQARSWRFSATAALGRMLAWQGCKQGTRGSAKHSAARVQQSAKTPPPPRNQQTTQFHMCFLISRCDHCSLVRFCTAGSSFASPGPCSPGTTSWHLALGLSDMDGSTNRKAVLATNLYSWCAGC